MRLRIALSVRLGCARTYAVSCNWIDARVFLYRLTQNGRRWRGKMKSVDAEHDNEGRRSFAVAPQWGAGPPRRKERSLFEGWGPVL